MWMDEMQQLYTEAYGPSSPNLPSKVSGAFAPRETADAVKMKGIFGAGGSPNNLLASSMASGQNPYEQEEDQMISKNAVLSLLNDALESMDAVNTLDQSGVHAITQLKSKIDKL